MSNSGRTIAGLILASACLAGCGPPLGDYRFENARLVSWAEFSRIEPEQFPEALSPDMLRIEFSSERDLETASEGGDLYLHADYCPAADPFRIASFGPYYGERSRYNSRVVSSETLPDGRIRQVMAGENRHPPRDPRTNRYVYSAYLIPSRPPSSRPGLQREGYDLRADARDLCLRFERTGYFLTPSRSRTFIVPGAAIAAALR